MAETLELSLQIAILSLVLGVVSFLFYLTTSRRKASPNPFPPSPPAHWLFGNALDLPNPATGPHIDTVLLEWSKQYGKVFSFVVPVVGRFIVVADPEFAKHILVTKNYRKSPTYGNLLDVVGETSILVSDGQDWYKKRRLFNPGFTPDFLRGVVVVVSEKCSRFVAKCRRDAEMGTVTVMHERATAFTSDVIAQVCFGEDWGTDDPDGKWNDTQAKLMDLLYKIVLNEQNPLRRIFNVHTEAWKIRRLREGLDSDMRAVVRRRMDQIARDEKVSSAGKYTPKDILSLVLPQLPAGENLGKDDIDGIVDQLKTFYFAGHDTTSTLIAWTVWSVAQHPDVCEKIRKEAISQLGEWALQQAGDEAMDATVQSPLPTYEALQRCTYLEAVLKETLRLYPPAATARYCDDPDAEFGGFRYGKCILYVCCFVMQRHPDLWENPDAFIPERFVDVDAADKRQLDTKFMPFSRGKRDCIGKYFAILEAKIAVAALLLSFDVTVVDEKEDIAAQITARPMNGAKVRLSARA